jgi:hypothetical protein
MAETATHMVDHVFPHVPLRQFVLSVPKRLRPYLHHRPKTATAVLHILLRALKATLKEASPTAPATASIGALSFLHRFGSSLNPQFIELSFASFDGLAGHLFGALRAVISRAARLARHGILEPHDAEDMLGWDHCGGFSLDAGVRIESHDRVGLERLIRYCARPPFALDRLHLVGGPSDQILYLLPKPDPTGRTALRLSALEFLDWLAEILPPPRIHRHRYHGVFAPNAPLRPLITARAREDNALAVHTSIRAGPLPPSSGGLPPKSEAP